MIIQSGWITLSDGMESLLPHSASSMESSAPLTTFRTIWVPFTAQYSNSDHSLNKILSCNGAPVPPRGRRPPSYMRDGHKTYILADGWIQNTTLAQVGQVFRLLCPQRLPQGRQGSSHASTATAGRVARQNPARFRMRIGFRFNSRLLHPAHVSALHPAYHGPEYCPFAQSNSGIVSSFNFLAIDGPLPVARLMSYPWRGPSTRICSTLPCETWDQRRGVLIHTRCSRARSSARSTLTLKPQRA